MPARHSPAIAPDATAAQRPSPRAASRRRTAPRRRPRVSRLLSWLLASFIGFTSTAHAQLAPGALPTGGKLVVGSGQIVQGGNVMQIHQTSGRLGLDWQSFNIGSGATVEFRQPGADSVALNRVLGNSGSEIYGRLKANGQVFLTNPNGILFAPGAKVDVGGLVASTLDLSQEDFASGRYLFTATGAGGEVVNRGSMNASAGGYLALFGKRVSNEGQIAVNAGSVVLASGRAATVSISGSGLISAVVSPGAAGSVANSGSISADGSVVTLSAHSAEAIASSLVNNSGIIRANTIVEKGGEVWITGDRAVQTGRIEVDASQGLAAGKVTVKGDMSKGSVEVGGSISARSLDGSGAGGTVETSAAHVKVAADARVDTRGKAGAYGTWTIDPTDFTVGAGSGTQTDSGIGADTLAANLVSSNVTLATSASDPLSGSEPGDLKVNAAVSWSADTTLTLQAARNIAINAPITATGTNAGLVLTPGSGGAYSLNNGARITLSGATPSLSIAGVAYTVINSLGAEGSTTGTDLQGMQGNLSSNYALGSDIDASATTGWAGGFKPVGDCVSYCYSGFQGRFDGLGHSITGLQIDRSAERYAGLFGYARYASIRNLELVGGSVRATRGDGNSVYAGGVLGYGYQVNIDQVRSSTGITAVSGPGTVYAGGLFGYLDNSSSSAGVSRSSATGSVYADGYYAYAGGLGGYFYSYNYYGNPGRIDASSASGRVDLRASYYVTGGGLIGYGNYGYNGAALVTDSSATGAVTAVVGGRGSSYGYARLGGLVGQISEGSVSNSQASGAVTADYAAGVSSGTTYVGGLVGYGSGSAISDAQASGAVGGSASQYAGGLVGYLSASNSSTTAPALDNVSASGAVTGGRYVGGLAGYVSGSIRNAFASGAVSTLPDVSYGAYVGGLAGYLQTTSSGGLVDSVATGQVSGGYYTGGLVGQFTLGGYSSGEVGIVNSHASGNVAGASNGYYAGGLVGYYYDSAYNSYSQTGIAQSYATGSVSGRGESGGLVGRFQGYRSISDSYATGAVASLPGSGGVYAGGLVGSFRNYASGSYGGSGGSGGIVRSFASGSVTVPDHDSAYYSNYAGAWSAI